MHRPVSTPGVSSGRTNAGGNGRESPGGGGGWAESSFLPGGVGGVVGGGEVVGAGRLSSAVGGGNTDANRPVGVPYPFKAAGSKHGGAGGTANETLLRFVWAWRYRRGGRENVSWACVGLLACACVDPLGATEVRVDSVRQRMSTVFYVGSAGVVRTELLRRMPYSGVTYRNKEECSYVLSL